MRLLTVRDDLGCVRAVSLSNRIYLSWGDARPQDATQEYWALNMRNNMSEVANHL